MFKCMRCFFLLWIALFSLPGCRAMTPQPIVPITQTATPANTPTTLPTPSQTVSSTPLPTPTVTILPTRTPAPKFPGLMAFLGTDEYASGLTPSRLDLFLLDGYGQLTRLTEDAAVSDFAWSPDGRKLVFSAILMDNLDFDLYMIDVDGTNLKPIAIELEINSQETDPIWSPDGQQIVFSQYLGGIERIYIMNSDGSNVRFLVEGGDPFQSYDGQHIAFVKRVLASAEGDIYMISTDGSEQRQLTDSLLAIEPVISPDGEKIVFTSNKGGQSTGIYVMQADGTGIMQLTDGLGWPSWFLTTQILFASKNRIYTLDIDDSALKTLIDLPANFYIEDVSLQPILP